MISNLLYWAKATLNSCFSFPLRSEPGISARQSNAWGYTPHHWVLAATKEYIKTLELQIAQKLSICKDRSESFASPLRDWAEILFFAAG